MIKLIRFIPVFFLSIILLSSCKSHRQVPYMQDLSTIKASKNELFEARIIPKDLLTITVHTSEPELAAPFNMTVQVTAANTSSLYSQPVLQQYLVDNDGNIELPVLGIIQVGGMRKDTVEQMIQEKLKMYLTDAIVTVRFVNYKISVLGEVVSPGVFTVPNEKINIFEALALAKDMTIYGQRTNVKIIRENAAGKQQVEVVNLTDANIVNSPYYYLQQNDIVYVTPNKMKARNSDVGSTTTIAISAVSILISIASLMFNILR